MLRCFAVALVAFSLAGCGLTCEQACSTAVECGGFDSSESADCVSTCEGAEDDAWLICMAGDDCAAVEDCSL